MLQEEASLAEAIKLDTLEKEEKAKQVHLDSLLAQRLAEEEELNEQQKKRRAQVQFEAQHYTDEDWDLIKAKIEANAELSKSVLGSGLQGEDFAKKMVELVNQRKKHFAEERARAKRNKPMTQSQLRTYMMNYLKNQGTWKLSQLKNLSFEEVKEEFDKLVKQLIKPTSIATYKIFKQGKQVVMNSYGMNGPEDEIVKGEVLEMKRTTLVEVLSVLTGYWESDVIFLSDACGVIVGWVGRLLRKGPKVGVCGWVVDAHRMVIGLLSATGVSISNPDLVSIPFDSDEMAWIYERRIQAFEHETQDLDVEIKQMKELKANYGVTTPQELCRNKINEGMSQHPSYSVNASSCIRRNQHRQGRMTYPSHHYGVTSTQGLRRNTI
ncbi:hypothetical protein Tco_0674838 [Tanacetum coccineum]